MYLKRTVTRCTTPYRWELKKSEVAKYYKLHRVAIYGILKRVAAKRAAAQKKRGAHPLVWIKGRFNQWKYRELIDQYLLPSAERFYGDVTRMILQEDNCGPHISKTIAKYLKEKNITRMDWLAQSPDLNPIENAWGYLKRRLNNRTDYAKNKEELFALLQKEWNDIPQYYFQELVGSTASRIGEEVKKQGWAY